MRLGHRLNDAGEQKFLNDVRDADHQVVGRDGLNLLVEGQVSLDYTLVVQLEAAHSFVEFVQLGQLVGSDACRGDAGGVTLDGGAKLHELREILGGGDRQRTADQLSAVGNRIPTADKH